MSFLMQVRDLNDNSHRCIFNHVVWHVKRITLCLIYSYQISIFNFSIQSFLQSLALYMRKGSSQRASLHLDMYHCSFVRQHCWSFSSAHLFHFSPGFSPCQNPSFSHFSERRLTSFQNLCELKRKSYSCLVNSQFVLVATKRFYKSECPSIRL